MISNPYSRPWQRDVSVRQGDNSNKQPLMQVWAVFSLAWSPKGLLSSASADGTVMPLFLLTYPWNRHLDGKDINRDVTHGESNPGAQVVGLLESGAAPWGIVTNGKLWRLYSAKAHSRATNYYEIDLEETLASPAPGEAFRYFYLFFRVAAFFVLRRKPRPAPHPQNARLSQN